MTPETLAELRRLASCATPGPWKLLDDYAYHPDQSKLDYEVCEIDGPNQHMSAFRLQDAAHIAAFNPATVLELLDEVERLIGEVHKLRDAPWPPDAFKCPKCNVRMQSSGYIYLEEERDRYRAALEKIAEIDHPKGCGLKYFSQETRIAWEALGLPERPWDSP